MSTFKEVWRVPFVLGAITLFGVLAALLGTGFWYWLSWAAMSLPVIVIGVKILRHKRMSEKLVD